MDAERVVTSWYEPTSPEFPEHDNEMSPTFANSGPALLPLTPHVRHYVISGPAVADRPDVEFPAFLPHMTKWTKIKISQSGQVLNWMAPKKRKAGNSTSGSYHDVTTRSASIVFLRRSGISLVQPFSP
jgi:hypothetical protein